MFASDTDLKKIEPINSLLESRYGIRVGVSDRDHMVEVCSHYQQKRDLLLKTLGEHQALTNPDYQKAVLITEAIRMLLREIAPRRLRKKKS